MTAALPKLTGWNKAVIRSHLKARQSAFIKARSDDGLDLMRATAARKIHDEWGEPAVQADMAVLHAYRVANPIGYAYFNVLNPESDCYDIRFAVEHDFGLMMPDRNSYYVGQERKVRWEGYVRKDDPEWPAFVDLDRLRRSYVANHEAELKALDDAMRKTSSMRKIIEAYPWVADIWADKP